MRKTIAILLMSTLAVSGCGYVRNSPINPLNWFGQARSAPVAASDNPLIPRSSGMSLRRPPGYYAGTPVDQITALTVERVPGGAILRIEGLARRQGSFNVKVEPATIEEAPVDGVLDYALMAELPKRSPVGAPASRRIIAAHFISDDSLAGARTIRVTGAQNVLTTRR